jgi:Serine/threonine protein kinase
MGGEGNKKIFSLSFNEGDVVKSRFEVLDKLGQPSGEALIYLCKDLNKNCHVVIKLYHQGFSAKEEIVKKLVSVTHKDVINIIDYGMLEDQFYEVMEFAKGGTLLDRLKEKPFSEEELVSHVLPEVLNGLKFCHENQIIHRDIKPGNLFYRDQARRDIVLGDFGISTLLDHDATVRKTKGALTCDFAAPEIWGWKGEHYVSKESDYYALGVTLLYLYLGQNPFAGLTEHQILMKHTSEKISLPETLSDRVKRLFSGLLIKVRKERWGASEIERWSKGEDVPLYEDVFDKDDRPKNPPYKLTETVKAEDGKKLAILLQTYTDVKLLKERLGRKSFSKWLDMFDPPTADKVSRVEERVQNTDLALLEISCILDTNISYYFTPELKAETPSELSLLIDKNRELGKEHFQSGRIKIWLNNTTDEGKKIWERWSESKLGDENTSNPDIVLESFLHCLNLQLEEARVLIDPSVLDIGTIESIATIKEHIRVTNSGQRGVFACSLSTMGNTTGISLKSSNKDTGIVLFPRESTEIIFEIDALQVPRFAQTYNVVLALTKKTYTFRNDFQGTIEIPISFYVDYPAYSKKKAKHSFTI